MKKVALLFTVLSLGVCLTNAQAQYNPKASYEGPYKMNTWSVSAYLGPSQFYGDLREYDFWPVGTNNFDSRSERGTWHFGVSLGKQLTYLFGARLDVGGGNLKGMKRRIYFSYFDANYLQADVAATVNLKGLLFGPTKMKRWKMDVYGGVGQVWFKSTAYQLGSGRLQRRSDDSPTLRNNTAELNKEASAYTQEWSLPVGFNVSYELTPNLDLGLDWRLNNVNTEKLDATVGGDPSSIYDGPSGGRLFQGGDAANLLGTPKGNSSLDKYGYMAVTLTYKLGKNPLRVQKKNGKWAYDFNALDAGRGFYHLRYTDPRLLVKPPKILTLAEIDSVAKANKPKEIDPRVLIDSDNDGVSDFFDKEPNTPAGSIVTGAGQKIDFDKYVKDALPGMACTEIFANVLFDTDKAIIKPEFYDLLNRVVELMNKTQCRLQMTGHADRRATDRYNVALSQRRVNAVKQYLTQAGLKDANRVVVDAYGSFKPIADNGTVDGLKKNRRVELKLMP
ncbi:MAG: OmpA family protein [Spirosomaceae bacterium]|jgi:OOP family OmpA-OmpF porin|nr:OmpA family protein [Spirosomataceae bacterium]